MALLTLTLATRLTARVAGRGTLSRSLLAYADGVLTVTATDYDATIVCTVAMSGDAPWGAMVDARVLAAVAAALGDDASLALASDGRVEVAAGRCRHRLASVPVDEWPSVDVADVPADAPPLPDLAPLASAMSAAESRPALCGVYIDDGVLVASDGHRLHMVDAPRVAALGILHRRGVEISAAMPGPLRYARDGRHVGIAGDGCTLTVRQIEEKFPAWRRVVPDETGASVVEVDAGALAQTVGRVVVIAAGKDDLVRLRGGSGELRIDATSVDIGDGSAAVEIPADVEIAEMGISPRYLLAALAAAGPGQVRLLARDPLSPVVIVGERARCVVMPMSL